MAALAAFLAGLFGSLVAWLAKYIGKRIAIAAAGIAALAAVTSATWATVSAAISGVLVAMPPEVGIAADLFLPTNLLACIAAVFANRVVIWVYKWNVAIIRMRMAGL